MSPAHTVLLLIVAASIVFMLVRPRGIAEVWWVGGGALLLVVCRLVPLRTAGKAVAEGTDVYLFLIGMMLLSELARTHGVFEWVAAKAVSHARGRCLRLFALIYGVGIVTTVLLSNDATAVVLTPAVLSAVRKAKVKPKPHLFACAMIANAASFALPISNPANLVVFHTGMPALGQWLLSFLVPSMLSIAVTFGVLRWYFRRELCTEISAEAQDEGLSPDGRLVLAGLLLVVASLLVTSALHRDLGLPTCLAAVAIALVISRRAGQNPMELAKGISWTTLLLVAGLFLLVRGVEQIGLLHRTQAALQWSEHLPQAAGVLIVSLAVGVLNNLVNNLPLGLVAGATVQAQHVKGLLANSLLIGVDLGPNLSVTGSLATILWLLALRKEKVEVSAWEFFRAGLLAMPLAVVAADAGLLLTHALGGGGR